MRAPNRNTAKVRVQRIRGDSEQSRKDVVAREEPLEIRLRQEASGGEWTEAPLVVTMRTPGHDFELAAGFLFAERILSDRGLVHEIRYCTEEEQQNYNVVTVELKSGVHIDLSARARSFMINSSCGVCGKGSIEDVQALIGACVAPSSRAISFDVLRTLPDRLRQTQSLFERTGGAHAAGAFTFDGEARWVFEDVGRHNAVDKVVGQGFLDGVLPLDDHVLVVSGRASFEIIQKAAAAGIAVVAAVGAPSSLAVELSRSMGMTLTGFTGSEGMNVYVGAVDGPGA